MTTPALPSSTHIVGDPAHTSDHNAIAAALNQAVYRSNNLSDIADAGSSRANIHVPILTPAACVATVNVPTLSGPGGATTIASGSNSASLPQATINVASTAAFPASGTINVVTGAGTQAVTYTGTTSTTFTGCTGGTGTMSTGGAITATYDGYLLASSSGAQDTILLAAQTTASQNGPWLIPVGVSGSWTRPTDFTTAAVIKGRTVRVLNGVLRANSDWTLVAPTAGITVDTSAQTWVPQAGAIPVSPAASSYTLALTDQGTVIEAGGNVTIPLAGAANFPIGSWVKIRRTSASAIAIGPAVHNLINNPNAATNTNGWTSRNANASLAQNGGGGVITTSVASGTTGVVYTDGLHLSDYGLAPGQQITAQMNIAGAIGANLGLRWLAGGSLVVADTYTAHPVIGVASLTMTIPAGSDSFVVITTNTATAGSQTVVYSQLMVVAGGTAPGTYQDGSSTGWGWYGTANASQSAGPVVRDGLTTLEQYGELYAHKRAANEWVLSNFVPNEVLTTSTQLNVDRDNGQAGMVAPGTSVATTTTLALVSGKGYLARFVPSRNLVVTELAFRVSTASATNDTVDVGIVSASGTLVTSNGGVTGHLNSTGTQVVTVTTTTLTAGTVYYAAISSNSTATLEAVVLVGDLFGSSLGTAEAMTVASGMEPLPSTVSGTGSADTVPLLAVRTS